MTHSLKGREAKENIILIDYLEKIVKLRFRSRSGVSGKVQLRELKTQRFGPEPYNKFGFHPPPSTTNFFWGSEGAYISQMNLGWVGMTQVWLEEVRTSRWTSRWISRWTSRWTSSRTSGGTSGSTSGSQMDPG